MFISLLFVEVGMGIELDYMHSAGLFALIYSVAAILSFSGDRNWHENGCGIIPAIAMRNGVVGPNALAILISMVFVTTIITPPLLKKDRST
ncbi:cation:proton antiporter [Pyrococcus yayanosii]|uniref:Na+/H+ antiporter, napA type (NapA) n=1 Tax=Pyrococcus yayanosii (strain CH1 / JCM 16557) TaxID=529709 RepID=F8AJ63_PYRYC|nr:hypothetical protein [Pyrococcus yayanosii]AEH24504.1 Na+/H+ antiporter, napA type (napA) [Pyrococcus yayanosii CH1]